MKLKDKMQKLEKEINSIDKYLNTYTKNNNIRQDQINKILDELYGINNIYMAWIETIGAIYNTFGYYKNINNLGGSDNNTSIHDVINDGLAITNGVTNATAMGLNLLSMTKCFGPLKLASGGLLLSNPWTIGALLFIEVGFAWLNSVAFNWGLGKVLGRNCIYVTPLNLNRTPMLAGLKGYNVYTDIETHINDEIFSLVNAPKEYLAGVLSDDTSFN